MDISEKKIALVTGGNRGIGKQVSFELARLGVHVLIGCRNPEETTDFLKEINLIGSGELLSLDVSKEQSITQAFDSIIGSYGKLDILINNAGILIDKGSFYETNLEDLQRTLSVNLFGPYRLTQMFLPLMVENGYGRIVNVSTGMGQLSDMGSGYPAYRISKTALNALTCLSNSEAKNADIKINSVCPGWVKTDMGGTSATRSVEQGAETIVWCANLPKSGPTGKFFRDKKEIPW